MSRFLPTDIGRLVRYDELSEFRKDKVISCLYRFYLSPFNDFTLTMTTDSVRLATGMHVSDVVVACSSLVREGYAEEPKPGRFRLTRSGYDYVSGVLVR